MALKAVHVSDVPNLDQVPENASLSLYSNRFPKGTFKGKKKKKNKFLLCLNNKWVCMYVLKSNNGLDEYCIGLQGWMLAAAERGIRFRNS